MRAASAAAGAADRRDAASMVPPWNVRYRRKSGKHLLILRFSHYDPTRTSPGLNGNLFRGQAKTHKIGADDDIPSKTRSLGVSTRGTELGATRRKKADGAVRG